jgi:chromate transporter
LIGGTSFGGGIIAHLRSSLIVKHHWIDDEAFLELLAISQSLPGLNAANMAILVRDRLSGAAGAIAAVAGLCLPGALLMYLVGIVYNAERERPLLQAALAGVAPAAVGLILATLKLGCQSLTAGADLVFLVLTVLCVNQLQMPVPRALLIVPVTARADSGPSVEALAWTSLDRHGPTRTHAGVNRPAGRRISHLRQRRPQRLDHVTDCAWRVRDRPPQPDQSRLSLACRRDRRSAGASLNAESRQNRIAIDGEKVIACCRGFFSSIRRTARRIQQKRPVFRAMASVVPFLKPSAPVARKG